MTRARVPLKTTKFDVTEYLDSEEAIGYYIDEALSTGDAGFIADSIGVIARARGMTQIAKAAGLSRESLYKALSPDGNPELSTLLKVIDALGLKLSAAPVGSTKPKGENQQAMPERTKPKARKASKPRVEA